MIPKLIVVYQKCCVNTNQDIMFLKRVQPEMRIKNLYGTIKIPDNKVNRYPIVVMSDGSNIPLFKFVEEIKRNLEVVSENDEQIVYDAGHRVIVENKSI